VTSQRQNELADQLARARERLLALMGDLREVEGEIESLGAARERHALVGSACAALEALAESGGAALFWGETGGDADARLRDARARVDAFDKHFQGLEDHRRSLVDEIAVQEDVYELAEYDVLELQREEENRKREWIVEREIGPEPAREAVLPWSYEGGDERLFRRSLAFAFVASVVFGVLVPQIPLPLPERRAVVEVPERLARLLQPPRPAAPPAPARPLEPRTDAKPIPETPRVAEQPAPAPGPTPESESGPGAGSTAGARGILAFREKLSGMARSAPGARLGLQARIGDSAEAASGLPVRSLVTSAASGSNAGVQLASISRGGGGGGGSLASVQVERATSAIGGGGGSARPGAGSGAGSSHALGRSDEEIQIVFDRHKAGLYRLYNRELRNDPTLKGQMVLRMRIEPDGSVSLCALQATDMDAPQLAAQVVERVRTFDFGAKPDVSAVTILYPIDFLPAT